MKTPHKVTAAAAGAAVACLMVLGLGGGTALASSPAGAVGSGSADVSLLAEPATAADVLPGNIRLPDGATVPDPAAARLAGVVDGSKVFVFPGQGTTLCLYQVDPQGSYSGGCTESALLKDGGIPLFSQNGTGSDGLLLAIEPDGYTQGVAQDGATGAISNNLLAIHGADSMDASIAGPAVKPMLLNSQSPPVAWSPATASAMQSTQLGTGWYNYFDANTSGGGWPGRSQVFRTILGGNSSYASWASNFVQIRSCNPSNGSCQYREGDKGEVAASGAAPDSSAQCNQNKGGLPDIMLCSAYLY